MVQVLLWRTIYSQIGQNLTGFIDILAIKELQLWQLHFTAFWQTCQVCLRFHSHSRAMLNNSVLYAFPV